MKMKPLHDRKGIKDIYKYYRTEDYKTKEEKVLYKEFSDICFEVNKRIAKRMLLGKLLKFSAGLGTFFIRKRKLNFDRLKFDYTHFNKTGEKSFYLNEHSNKFYAKWFWQKINCRIPGNSIYSFIPTRQNKRALSQVMQEAGGYKKYVE